MSSFIEGQYIRVMSNQFHSFDGVTEISLALN